MSKGQIQVYTGNGKGKTTAALGLAIRALGNDMKVGIIYFDKGGNFYKERKILDKLISIKLNLIYKAFGLIRMNKKGFRFKNKKGDLKEAKKGLRYIEKYYKKNLNLLILDELNTTIKTNLLAEQDIIKIIKKKPEKLELILTGRYCPNKIITLADLVTEMKEIKHYIQKKIKARPGIDY
tara:strand:- start:49 stop:588 length:540 start_codon:yes stop_codon:yes gene_type:complete